MTKLEKAAEERKLSPGDRKLERSKKKLNKAIRIIGAIFLVIMLVVLYTVLFRSVTKSDTCHALSKNDQIFQKLLEHTEQKSIQNVKAGITSGTTTIKEVKGFYEPSLRELKAIHCGY